MAVYAAMNEYWGHPFLRNFCGTLCMKKVFLRYVSVCAFSSVMNGVKNKGNMDTSSWVFGRTFSFLKSKINVSSSNLMIFSLLKYYNSSHSGRGIANVHYQKTKYTFPPKISNCYRYITNTQLHTNKIFKT